MMRYVLFIISLLSLHLFAQEANIKDFRVYHENNYVVVSWTTDSGYICADVSVLHSTNNEDFEQVYNIPGICGSFIEEQTYTYIHSGAEKEKWNYYKLSSTESNIDLDTAIFCKSSTEYFATPNPATTETVIYLNNNFVNYQIEIYDVSGKLVYKSSGVDQFIKLNLQSFLSGTYYFSIQVENGDFSRGKMIVL